jgi:hypothetical protein
VIYFVVAVVIFNSSLMISRNRAGTIIGMASNLSFLLSVLVHPYMPATSEEIRSQLQVSSYLIVGVFVYVSMWLIRTHFAE